MKTRNDIITAMCYTYRHDYGLNKLATKDVLSAGTTESERQMIWNVMAELFDRDIAPHMTFKLEETA